MTKDELLSLLKGSEWNDFEAKEAGFEVPKSAWETVSAFSNSYGGWIVFGIKEKRIGGNSVYEIQGVDLAEKIEQDFVNVLRSNSKFNQRISVLPQRFDFDGKIVLAFYIPMSEFKPVYMGVPSNSFIRMGSGDQKATEYEIRAMQRDQAFGKKSNEAVFGSSYKNINQNSFQDYRSYLRAFNPELPYNTLSDTDFAVKTGIMFNGLLSVGGLLMFGNIDSILQYNPDFLIDYIEIPGTTIHDAGRRYSFRLQEQENIWEYYKVILQRLRTRVDNPFSPRADGIAPDDNTQLYCLREALVNMLAYADYFSEIHSTVRVYDNSIHFQNGGSFPVNLDIVGRTIVSQPRNPNLLRFFKLAKISENGGYGIDKILNWKNITGCSVSINSDITKSDVIFELPMALNKRHQPYSGIDNNVNDTIKGENDTNGDTNNDTIKGKNDTNNTNGDTKISFDKQVLALIKENNVITISELVNSTSHSKSTVNRAIAKLKKDGVLTRMGNNRNGKWVVTSSDGDSEKG